MKFLKDFHRWLLAVCIIGVVWLTICMPIVMHHYHAENWPLIIWLIIIPIGCAIVSTSIIWFLAEIQKSTLEVPEAMDEKKWKAIFDSLKIQGALVLIIVLVKTAVWV